MPFKKGKGKYPETAKKGCTLCRLLPDMKEKKLGCKNILALFFWRGRKFI
jgi:hypothetical protein